VNEKRFGQNETIFRQGDSADLFYIIDSGECQCTINDDAVRKLSNGDYFGELALLHGTSRTATVKATTYVVVFAMTYSTFNTYLKQQFSIKRNQYEPILSRASILHGSSSYDRALMIDSMVEVNFSDQQPVIRQGDAGQHFYIITKGQAKATKLYPNQTKYVEVLRYDDNGYFGELALMNNEPRAASITAQGELKCVMWDRSQFTRLFGPYFPVFEKNAANYAQEKI